MSVEELLIPRYKVIADYPGSPYTVGQIIHVHGEQGVNCEYFNKWPAIFKPLQWWEERDKNDMPEYVKSQLWVAKVKEWSGDNSYFTGEVYNGTSYTQAYLPATQEEFEQYTNQQSKQ